MKILDVVNAPWAIIPGKLLEIADIYRTHLRGDKIDVAGVEARLGRPLVNDSKPYDIIDGVAVIDVVGAIAKRMNLFSQISGGASTQIIENEFLDAIDNQDVNSIVLNIDSPGGTVDGTFELADLIFENRGSKPIVAVANGLMASAAYAIGAAADSIYMTGDTTLVGSIGVVATHVDVSEAEKTDGVKTTEITAGKFKRIASNYEPLTEDGRADIQLQVDELYAVFVDRVAKFRGVSVETVLEDMADGRIFVGQRAIDAGLVDGVSTISDLITKLSTGESLSNTRSDGVSGETLINEQEGIDMPEEKPVMTLESVTADYPEIANALLAQGATAERERIVSVKGQSIAGHETLIETLMFDGETSGPEAAVMVLNAERDTRKATADDIEADAPEAVDNVVSIETNTVDASELPFDEQCKLEWDADASLRNEFEDFAAYQAFQNAMAGGQVKILTNK